MYFKFLIKLILLCTFFSCGDNGIFGNVNDGEGERREFVDKRIANCTLDTTQFEYILEKDLSGPINCLHNQLSFYMDLAEKADTSISADNVSYAQLKQLINNKYPQFVDLLPDFKFYIELINYGVGNKRNDLLVKTDLSILKDFLLMFNTQAIKIFKILEDYPSDYRISVSKHEKKKAELLNALELIALKAKNSKGENISISNVLNRNRSNNSSFSLNRVLTYFLSEDHSEMLENILKFNFLKRMFLGGDDDALTRREFRTLAENKIIPGLNMFYDFYRFKNIDFNDKTLKTAYQTLYRHSEQFRNQLLYRGSDVKYYFTLDHVYSFLRTFGNNLFGLNMDSIKIEKYDWEIARIKEIYLGNTSRNFTYGDMSQMINFLQDILKIGITFPDLYKKNEDRLSKGTKLVESEIVNNLRRNDFSYYQDFRRILMKYRYFKGEKALPVFGDNYARSLGGIINIAQLERAITPLINFYEKKYPCTEFAHKDIHGHRNSKNDGNYYIRASYRCASEDYQGTIAVSQLAIVLKEFIGILSDVGVMMKGDEEGGASNVALMSDLFHYTSNGDGIIQIEEITEFLMNLIYAVDIKSNISRIVAHPSVGCKVVDTIKAGDTRYPLAIRGAGKRYDAKCVRKNFFELFKKPLGTKQGKYFDYFTKFKSYYDDIVRDQAALSRFQMVLEKFTRPCSQDNMPFSEADILAVMAGMFAIESTIAKFDQNKNNIIDVAEADKQTYAHFKPSLKKLNSILEKSDYYTKQTFWYVLKHRKVPSTKAITDLTRLTWPWAKKVPADRTTFAAVLIALNGQGDLANIEDTNCINYCYGINRAYVPTANKCRGRLPLKEKKLSCNAWADDKVLGDIGRNDCDLPSKYAWDVEKIPETDTSKCVCN